MTTIYLVNEKPDGSGRWRNIGMHRWVESGDFATNFVDRDQALWNASECGGHVVEFTMGGAKVEPREDLIADQYVEIADALGLVNRAEGQDGVEVAPHERVMEAVRDGQRALAESDEMFAELQRLRTERNKPEPREPDAIVVCDDEGVDWDDIFPCPLTETGRDWLDQCTNLTRKVYLDTPPPASGREEWSALKELLAEMTAEKAAALAEVSRLSKALDGARRETESVRVAAREIQRERDELAKQEPVAWRRQAPLGEEFFYGRQLSQESIAAWRHRGHAVEPLYAAPKPAEAPAAEPAPIDAREAHRRAKERAEAAVAAVAWKRDRKAVPPPPDTPDDLTAKYAAWETGEPTPDTPATVEANRLIREGWEPDGVHNTGFVRHEVVGRGNKYVGKATVDAMRALRGGK